MSKNKKFGGKHNVSQINDYVERVHHQKKNISKTEDLDFLDKVIRFQNRFGPITIVSALTLIALACPLLGLGIAHLLVGLGLIT